MRIKKLTAVLALAVAAFTVTQATAFAQPDPAVITAAELPGSATGEEQGVGYTVNGGADGRTLTAALTSGTFRVTGEVIEIADAAGAVVASVPLHIPVGQHQVSLAPRVEDDGTKLIAAVSAQEIGYWRMTSPRDRSIEAGAGIGAVLGSLAGGFLGVVLGIATMGLLLPITLPIGLIVGLLGGMAAGGAAGASVPNSDVPDRWNYQQECEYYRSFKYCW
ncbi:hypothetical protein [Nocardia jiangsuensis]|uniref:DUF8020 domain-containing protein n=1 Tax=Nocardia jiangsuensis TaxID=1691563 RepID=A0ABV8DLS1_9NOCA